MHRIPAFVLAAGLLVLSTLEAAAETRLRVAAWNIANFHHKERVEVRPNIGTERKAIDFEILGRYADGLEADLIALQEIGTPQAPARLFPPGEFTILMSSRYAEDAVSGPPEDIYTAIAVRNRPDIEIVAQQDIDDLEILHSDTAGGQGHPTRRGPAVHLKIAGQDLWLVSVHLKSSCSHIMSADTSGRPDCKTFWKQRIPLKAWIDERNAEGVPFIITGDFNRRFRQFDFAGPMWTHLNGAPAGAEPDEPLLVAHPEFVTRKCPTRKGSSTQPIDWILMDAGIADWFVEGSFWETRYKKSDVDDTGGRHSSRLSDHCPIHIDLAFE